VSLHVSRPTHWCLGPRRGGQASAICHLPAYVPSDHSAPGRMVGQGTAVRGRNPGPPFPPRLIFAGAAGKRFNPHVTIGVGTEEYLNKMLAEPFDSFTFSAAGASVYQLGSFGAAGKELKALTPCCGGIPQSQGNSCTYPCLRTSSLHFFGRISPSYTSPTYRRPWPRRQPRCHQAPSKVISEPEDFRTALVQAAARSRVARTGSFRTLQSAFRFSARGRIRPISQKYTQGAVTPTCEASPHPGRTANRGWF
jgi:hypothetical protein